MLRFMVPVILSLLASTKAYHPDLPRQSAASEAQIRFAIENKYDDTGPGAKEPPSAYNTFKNLEDALIGFLDDPDTKLPQQDRNRAVQKLVQNYGGIQRYYPKTVEEYTGYNKQIPQEFSQPEEHKPDYNYITPKPPLVLTKLRYQFVDPYYQGSVIKELDRERLTEPYRLQKIRVNPVRGNPLSLAHYSRGSHQHHFNQNPKYTSYGVNGPDTGDLKSAHETRDGGTVRGYYSFLDADGARRTVTYTADDELGFQANVDRRPQ